MVSGKPPRHSKSTTEPVTIDLDSKDVKDIGKDKDAGAIEAKPAKEPEAAVPSEKTSAFGAESSDPKPIWDNQVKKPIEPEPNIHKAGDVKADQTAKPAAAGTTTVPPFKSEPLKSDKTTTQPRQPEASKPATDSKTFAASPSNVKSSDNGSGSSGALLAGIVGGLIALFAAGSMQYAGYLPSFSSSNGSSDELASLKTEVESLRQQIANGPQATADTSALETRLAALESSTASGGGDVTDKLASLESTLSTLQSEKAAQDAANADLTRRLSDVETKINEPRDDIEVARAIASAGLKAAIDRGGPFLTELDTLSRVTPDDPAIQSLRPFANTGVPSRSELTRNFPEIANAMLGSLNQTDPNQGIVDRLAESALSLVKVRPVGNVEGEGAEAKIARIEDKLRNGDLKGASLEWDGLPEPAKTASQDFKTSLDARVQVEDLVNGTLTRAISSTGQQG
ncbi:hypothetical protein GGQ73_002300 [Rhizobium skierniewicense]|uniref:YbgF trimerisation domain-containing protein n=1 Tax=Rhizobium skierniewicense TaxID=984260 RepID=A0A7W6C5X7_9HYPH|nr:COG4223 family protein [Rhizobium skierniewicense]MBB3946347.1 hypothetical protein [Rhizobium skierniewicense]